MNISFVLNRLNNKEKYLEIIAFSINPTDSNDELYPKICHNLSGAYIRNKEYEKALFFSELAIETCQKI